MAVRTYSLADVQVIFGPVVMGGYGEDGGVSVEHDENDYEYTPNADGGGTRSANSQNSATITITLSQSAQANDLLSAIRAAGLLTGADVLPLLIRDANGTSLHAATSCWIQKPPTAEYNKAVSGREWVLRTDDLASFFGSNAEA